MNTNPVYDSVVDRVVFSFGQVVNAGDNVVNGDDEIEIEVLALVENTVATNDGSVMTAFVSCDYFIGVATANVGVSVVEPVLNISMQGSVVTADGVGFA
jgi:hypothetical protein